MPAAALTESVENGVVEPKPVFTAKLILSLLAPKVSVLPVPWPLMVEFSSKTRFAPAPTSPIVTSVPPVPIVTVSEPVRVSTLKRGLAVLDVAIVHAYALLFGTVEVEAAEYVTSPPEIESLFVASVVPSKVKLAESVSAVAPAFVNDKAIHLYASVLDEALNRAAPLEGRALRLVPGTTAPAKGCIIRGCIYLNPGK